MELARVASLVGIRLAPGVRGGLGRTSQFCVEPSVLRPHLGSLHNLDHCLRLLARRKWNRKSPRCFWVS
jgi:hypothetical protein